MVYAIRENEETIDCIREAYLSSNHPWYIGFSGGKDSSAVLKLTFLALSNIHRTNQPNVTVLYCDTGVDIPIIKSLVDKTLSEIAQEAVLYGVPLQIKIAKPLVHDTYFSKVIGKGYPSPTNKFRWCTDRLRIRPIDKILKNTSVGENIILLGIRKGESLERDKTLSRHATKNSFYYSQANNSKTTIFAPIIDYTVEDVWATIAYNDTPKSIDAVQLMSLYRKASGECPIIRDPKGSPCGKGRFGCWTCTVVRKDKAVQSLIDEGYAELKPLLEFRNWLIEIRDNHEYRSTKRRNGQTGLGPFTLQARYKILENLRKAEELSGYQLLEEEEWAFIQNCWAEDKNLF